MARLYAPLRAADVIYSHWLRARSGNAEWPRCNMDHLTLFAKPLAAVSESVRASDIDSDARIGD